MKQKYKVSRLYILGTNATKWVVGKGKIMAKKNIELGWGSGDTTLFVAPCNDGGLMLLDYEFDYEQIHEKCGGKCYYQSRSGASGTGYIHSYADMIPVGYYRVDTAYNEWHSPVEIYNDINIMFPYASHQKNKKDTLENNPVVIKVGSDTLIYCGYYTNMNAVLTTLLSGESLKETPQVLKRTFVEKDCWGKRCEKEVEVSFYNLFGHTFYPWEFLTELLKDSSVYYPEERVYSIFRLSKCEDGTLVKTSRIGQSLYATKILEADPCESVTEAIPGWEIAETNMLYKLREKEVYIIGWELAKPAYDKVIERVSRFVPSSEAEEFKNFIREYLPSYKYVEFEANVPKMLFILNREKQYAAIRKGIAKKVREDVFSAAKQFMESFNDNQILEAIPDDLVITLEDSWTSGNCRPGTQAFVDQYFPGKTETTAGELKKYSDNWNVMRIFRYIATRNKIAGKISLVLPE